MSDNQQSPRSSILKPPKQRNPLCDVDMNPPNTETTFMKSRRVSFANSNFVKEFTADLEKNTIWHDSYEEVVNKSEDSKNNEHMNTKGEDYNNSQDITSDQDDLNCTIIGSLNNISITSSNDVTSAMNFNHPDRADFTEISMNSGRHMFSSTSSQQSFHNVTALNQNDMESNRIGYINEICSEDMELTQPIRPELNIKSEQIINENNSNVKIHLMQQSNQESNFTNIKITGAIPKNSNLLKNVLKSPQESKNDNQISNVKYPVTTIPTTANQCNENIYKGNRENENRPNSNNLQKRRQTIHFEDDNLDITQTLPVHIIEKINKSKQHMSTVHFKENNNNFELNNQTDLSISHSAEKIKLNQCAEDVYMDLTEVLPQNINFVHNKEDNMNNSSKYLQVSNCDNIVDNKDLNLPTTIASRNEAKILDLEITIENNESSNNDDRKKEIQLSQNSFSQDKLILSHIDDEKESDENKFVSQTNIIQPSMSDVAKIENVFNLKGFPLILSPDSNIVPNNSNDNDICLIQYPDCDKESTITSKINLTDMVVTPISNHPSSNLNKNMSSLLDSTEKLINYKIDLIPSTEYIKSDLNIHSESTMILDENINLSQSENEIFEPIYIHEDSMNGINKRFLSENIICSTSNIPHKKIRHNRDEINYLQNPSTISNENERNISDLISNFDVVSKMLGSSNKIDASFKINHDDSSLQTNTSSVESEDDVQWQCMVEKSSINPEVLSSENVSLVNSFEGDVLSSIKNINIDTHDLLLSSDNETKDQERYSFSLPEFANKILDQLKNTKKIDDTHIINAPLVDEERKSGYYRKRFRELCKKLEVNEEVKQPTLEEKIYQKSDDALWKIVNLNSKVFTFTFMFDTIEFVVHIEGESGVVHKAQFFSQFCELTSHPSAIYVHKILKKELSLNHIRSVIGQTYNVLSLLDYINTTGEQMGSILNEIEALQCRYGAVFDRNLNVTIQFTNIYLRVAFEVRLNINNIENITGDDITVKLLIGRIDPNSVKKLIKGCPQGIYMLKAFILNINGYLKLLETLREP